MHVASTDGVSVAVHDLGGTGEPLVLAHANGFHALAYRELAAQLAATFRVWGVDLRAHGDATRPTDGALSWWSLSADVLAAVDALGLDSPVGFGHSMGGAALTMAELDRPWHLPGPLPLRARAPPGRHVPGHRRQPGSAMAALRAP